MKRLPVAEEDRRSVADWYERWSGFVADVNFKPVRAMFAEDAIAFGSKVEVMTSQAQLEAEQWRSVWPSIEDYRFDTSTLEVIMSPDRLMAMGALIFRSTGLHPGRQEIRAQRPRHRHADAPLDRRAVDLHALPRLAQARHAGNFPRQAAGKGLSVPPTHLPPELETIRARDVRQTRVPRSAQAGGRRDRVRQPRHHRTAADGCLRGRERHPLHPRPAGGRADGDGRRLRPGLRQAHRAQPARRARPRQRHGHALRRADGGLADPGDGRPAGHRISRRRAHPFRRPDDAGEAVREILRAGRAPQRPAEARASRRQDRARAADRPGVPGAARRHPEERRRHRSAGADPRRAAHPRRYRCGRCRRRSAGQGRAPGHHRRRRRGAEPRAQGACGAGRS